VLFSSFARLSPSHRSNFPVRFPIFPPPPTSENLVNLSPIAPSFCWKKAVGSSRFDSCFVRSKHLSFPPRLFTLKNKPLPSHTIFCSSFFVALVDFVAGLAVPPWKPPPLFLRPDIGATPCTGRVIVPPKNNTPWALPQVSYLNGSPPPHSDPFLFPPAAVLRVVKGRFLIFPRGFSHLLPSGFLPHLCRWTNTFVRNECFTARFFFCRERPKGFASWAWCPLRFSCRLLSVKGVGCWLTQNNTSEFFITCMIPTPDLDSGQAWL